MSHTTHVLGKTDNKITGKKMTTYYLILKEYVGPNTCYPDGSIIGDSRELIVSTEPGRTNLSHEYGKKEQQKHKLIWIDSFIKGDGALDVRPVKIKLPA